MDDLLIAARRQLLPNGLGELEGCGDPRCARDIAVGEPWVFAEHRTMAEVITAERQP
jgi:hypothetical protein